MLRLTCGLAGLALSACAGANDLNAPPPDLGNFGLAQTVVIAPTLTKGPLSREVDPALLTASVKQAVETRFSRHKGQKGYNFGIALEGYILAKAGVPVVAAPASLLLIAVTVWDDAGQRKLNDMPKRFTVVEDISGETVIGSGNTQTADIQVANLSRNAAKVIENWLLEQKREEGWFTGPVARSPGAEVPQQTPPTARQPARQSGTVSPPPVSAPQRQPES